MKCQSRFTQTSNGLVSPRINTVLWSNGIISVCKSTFSTNVTKKSCQTLSAGYTSLWTIGVVLASLNSVDF